MSCQTVGHHSTKRCSTCVPVRPPCPLPVTYVLLHPPCPSLSCPRGPPCTLSKQPPTVPFMGHKANDTALLCSILYICHFYSNGLCSPYLCMHELPQIELRNWNGNHLPVSQWVKGNNFFLFEAKMSCLLFLGESYGCVALFTEVFLYILVLSRRPVSWFHGGFINLSGSVREWGQDVWKMGFWSWQQCTAGLESPP